jgi:hypothetical protein
VNLVDLGRREQAEDPRDTPSGPGSGQQPVDPADDLAAQPAHVVRVIERLGVQAFSAGRHLAVQFHPEVDGAQLGRWLDGGAREAASRAGVDPDRLLAETIAEEPAARDRGHRLVGAALSIAAAEVAGG